MSLYRITSKSGTWFFNANKHEKAIVEAEKYNKKKESITIFYNDKPVLIRIGKEWYRLGR